MRAVQAARHGSYDAVEWVEVPRPRPGPGDVLVRVAVAGVVPLDRLVLSGALPMAKPPPLVLGNEGSGAVVEDPSGRFASGERVTFFAGQGGLTRDGVFAEYALVPRGYLARLPDGVPDEVGGALGAYPTAVLSLRQAGFTRGRSVFAPGVGGGVGHATLAVARALGAGRLVSTAGSPAKLAAARADRGLDDVEIIDLSTETVADGLARLVPEGVDVVVDSVGGQVPAEALTGLARGGHVVVMGYSAGTETTLAITEMVWKRATLTGFSLFAASEEQYADAMATVLPMVADGRIVPAVDRTYPLRDAAEALRHLAEDRPFGKVLLTVGEGEPT